MLRLDSCLHSPSSGPAFCIIRLWSSEEVVCEPFREPGDSSPFFVFLDISLVSGEVRRDLRPRCQQSTVPARRWQVGHVGFRKSGSAAPAGATHRFFSSRLIRVYNFWSSRCGGKAGNPDFRRALFWGVAECLVMSRRHPGSIAASPYNMVGYHRTQRVSRFSCASRSPAGEADLRF